LHTGLANAHHEEVDRVYREELKPCAGCDSGRWALLASLADRGVDWAWQLADEELPKILSSENGISVFFDVPFGKWRSERLEQAVATIGPRAAERMMRRHFERPNPEKLDLLLKGWVAHAIRMFGTDREQIRTSWISEYTPSTITFAVTPLSGREYAIPQSLKPPPSWTAFNECLNFARQPSAESLANALESAAHAFDRIEMVRFWMPWPLSASLGTGHGERLLDRRDQLRRDGERDPQWLGDRWH